MTEIAEVYEVKNDEALTILERCKSLKIKTAEDFARSAEDYAVVNKHIKEIETYWEKPIDEANKAHKSLCALRTDALKPWQLIRGKISAERNNYQIEQECIHQETQRKAEEQARKIAEKEKQKLLEQAIKAEEKGKTDKVEVLLEKAEQVYIEPVIVESNVEKKTELSFGGSLSSQKDFDVEVTDAMAICKAIVNSILPLGIIEFKNQAIKTF